MPNWIVHMGLTFFLFRIIPVKLKDFRLILIGSILPDLEAMLYVFILDVLPASSGTQEFVIWYFQPWHTPFMAFFYSWALALIISGSKIRNFLLIYSAALMHFLLDATQIHVGFWQLLAYPFAYGNYNFNLFYVSSPVYMVLTVFSFFLIIWAFFIQKEDWHFDFRYIGIASVFMLFVFLFPLATKKAFYDSNYHYLQFFSGQKNFEGKEIDVCVSKVINTNPLQCIEVGKILNLVYDGPEQFHKGDEISFKGILKKGQIHVFYMKQHTGYLSKVITSLIGLFLLIFFLLRGGVHARRQLSKKLGVKPRC